MLDARLLRADTRGTVRQRITLGFWERGSTCARKAEYHKRFAIVIVPAPHALCECVKVCVCAGAEQRASEVRILAAIAVGEGMESSKLEGEDLCGSDLIELSGYVCAIAAAGYTNIANPNRAEKPTTHGARAKISLGGAFHCVFICNM